MIDVICKDDDIAEHAGDEVTVEPFLLHQQMNERPIALLILQPKRVLWKLTASPELEIVASKAMPTQDCCDDLRCGLMLKYPTGMGQSQPRNQGFNHEFVAVEIGGLFALIEVGDATDKFTWLGAAGGNAEAGLLAKIIGTIQFLRMGERDTDPIRFT